jgi:hypothetical protein
VNDVHTLDFVFSQRQIPFCFIFFKEFERSFEQRFGEDILLHKFAKFNVVKDMAVMDIFFRFVSVPKSVMGKPTSQISGPSFRIKAKRSVQIMDCQSFDRSKKKKYSLGRRTLIVLRNHDERELLHC